MDNIKAFLKNLFGKKDKFTKSKEWGKPCIKCFMPAYNNRGNGYCYCCDPGIFE